MSSQKSAPFHVSMNSSSYNWSKGKLERILVLILNLN
jgi:hypothetical protein